MRTHIGVIVGRFQEPSLHAGHRHLIDHVLAKHNRVLIFIGCSPIPLSLRNPLDYESRAGMIREAYPQVTVERLFDDASDEIWSKRLDSAVALHFGDTPAVLYGSRDNFFVSYTGKYPCKSLPVLTGAVCGTEYRKNVTLINSADFRAGMIYASKLTFPTSFQVVDVAVVKPQSREVLLGRKKSDGEQYRFIGGFVDPTDDSLELAARREASEETHGMATDEYVYLGSCRIDDWRYRRSRDGMMSAFFCATYVFGRAEAGDDMDELSWHPIDQVEDLVISSHKPLAQMLCAYVARKE